MLHVEAVIRMLDPGYNLVRIAVKRGAANRGTAYRRTLNLLSTLEQPFTATDIAWKVLEAVDLIADIAQALNEA